MVLALKACKKTRLSKNIATIHHSPDRQVIGRLYYTSSTAINNGASSTAINNGGVAPEELLKVIR